MNATIKNLEKKIEGIENKNADYEAIIVATDDENKITKFKVINAI